MSFDSLDAKTAYGILSKPPFVKIHGVHNVRDLGRINGSMVKPGYVYRSAEICGVAEHGEIEVFSVECRLI